MSFLDGVIETAQKAGSFVYTKTSGAVDYVTLEYKCSALRTKIDEYYKALGKLVYDGCKKEQSVEDKKISTIGKIDELEKELSELCELMSKYKQVCPNCQKVLGGKAEFCSACGSALK